ncbi:MAG: hypothetical protein AAB802_03290 [Patescibacteria group bacterium]
MASYLLTVSPKGQITIPVSERKKFKHQKCLLEVKNKTFTLKPVEIKVIEEDLEDFAKLAEPSFEFWDNPEDNIYQNYYENSAR